MRGEPWLLSFEEGPLPVMTWHILLGTHTPLLFPSMFLFSCLIELLPYGGRIVYDVSEILLWKSKEPQENKKNFYVLTPEREKENVWGKAAYAVKGKKELSKLCKEYERNPKAKCALHLPAFIEFSSARPQGTRLCWLAKKNVIKAQPELGQVSNHSLITLPPSLPLPASN